MQYVNGIWYYPPWVTYETISSDFQLIHDWGFNEVTIPMHPEFYYNNSTYKSRLTYCVNKAVEKHLWVKIDLLHQWQLNKKWGGTGFPDDMFVGFGDTTDELQRAWTKIYRRELMNGIDPWERLKSMAADRANIYKNNANVIAMQVLNEPYWPNSWMSKSEWETKLVGLHEYIITGIRNMGVTKLLLISGPATAWWIPSAIDPDQIKPNKINLGYDAHEYFLSLLPCLACDSAVNDVNAWRDFVYNKGYGDFQFGEIGDIDNDPYCIRHVAHSVNDLTAVKNKGWVHWGARVQNAACNIMENATLREFLRAEIKPGLIFP